MSMVSRRNITAAITACALAAGTGGVAHANTSHEGWPKIDGVLMINKNDGNDTIGGTAKSDELLGGHDSDTISGGDSADVLWGDYKPSGQGTAQVDRIDGGAGSDFIYASHGQNFIVAGPGNDTIHAHYGRGSIDCGPGHDTLFISHRAKRGYHISRCEKISFKTIGH
jgi:Ca2+-binding RTX toxin-like protein